MPPVEKPLTPSDQALLLARDLARPGFMTLSTVRHEGEVVDFVWDFASAVAARLPCHAGLDLRGRRLLHVLDGRHPETFGCYLRVLLHGRPETTRQVHRVHGLPDIHRHAATRLGDGVAVTLTNLSAVRRLQALQLETRLLQAAARDALYNGFASPVAPPADPTTDPTTGC